MRICSQYFDLNYVGPPPSCAVFSFPTGRSWLVSVCLVAVRNPWRRISREREAGGSGAVRGNSRKNSLMNDAAARLNTAGSSSGIRRRGGYGPVHFHHSLRSRGKGFSGRAFRAFSSGYSQAHLTSFSLLVCRALLTPRADFNIGH